MTAMVPTEFGTYGLPVLGVNTVPIVNRAPYPRRVLIAQTGGFATQVFISSIAAELSMQTGGAPGGAIPLPVFPTFGVPLVIPLPAGQPLFAAAAGVGTRVSVSVSGDIPVTDTLVDLYETTFRSYAAVTVGTRGAPVVVPSGAVPRRVVIRCAGQLVTDRAFLATDAGTLNNVGVTTPGTAFELLSPTPPLVFVLAPRQSLYAIQPVGGSLDEIFVTTSDVQTGSPQGLTGIPGPGSQE